MTIPGDVRDVIMEALSVLLGRQDFEGEPSERTVNAMNWLDAQPDAPEVMTIPEDVRNWIASAAQVASDSARYYDVDPSTSDAVLAWLDAQPAAPEPDWTQAPARWPGGAVADWHTINADGCGRWHWYEPYVAKREWLSVIFSDEVCDDGRIVRYDLPIGVDWRTTLRHRPEEVTL